MVKKFTFLILFIIISSCNNFTKSTAQNNNLKKEVAYRQVYNFKNPKVLKLNSSLKEISGLSYYDGFLFTHNDEEGIIFKIDPNTGNVIDNLHFGKDADYEGIEIINNKATIVKSNGDLSFYDFETKELKIEKNKLKTENNVEGLCLKNTNELLIACKGETLGNNFKNKEKAIYSYHLTKNELNAIPFLNIFDNEIEMHLQEEFKDSKFPKKHKNKLTKRAIDFSPSGIAIHPKTKEIFILSAKGITLFIFSASKELKDIIFLDKKHLPQPEGICFDDNSDLYISTEVKEGAGKIYKYAAK